MLCVLSAILDMFCMVLLNLRAKPMDNGTMLFQSVKVSAMKDVSAFIISAECVCMYMHIMYVYKYLMRPLLCRWKTVVHYFRAIIIKMFCFYTWKTRIFWSSWVFSTYYIFEKIFIALELCQILSMFYVDV